jgi:hypothetical protein
MQVKTLDLETVRMMMEKQELMGVVDAYKPGVGQASGVATRLEEQRQAQREMEQAVEWKQHQVLEKSHP